MKNFLKLWLGITELELRIKVLTDSHTRLSKKLDNKIKELDKLTREDWDIGIRGSSTIILTGVWRGKGYVRFYDVPDKEFDYLVREFQERKKLHLVRNVDYPYYMSGAFELKDKI